MHQAPYLHEYADKSGQEKTTLKVRHLPGHQ